MNTALKTILIVIGVFITLGILGSFFSTPYSDTSNESMVSERQYKIEAFVDACSPDGAMKKECTCAANKVIDTYTEQQIKDIIKERENTGNLPQSFVDIVKSCIEGAV